MDKSKKLILNWKYYYVSIVFRVLDYVMMPLMFILSWFKKDSIQETHIWHCENISPDLINADKASQLYTDSQTWVKGSWLGLIHMPFIWGWKDYIVISNLEYDSYWFVGWKVQKYWICKIHKLPIFTNKIKLLIWPWWDDVIYFWFNKNWKQISVEIIDKWVVGDYKYQDIRLF